MVQWAWTGEGNLGKPIRWEMQQQTRWLYSARLRYIQRMWLIQKHRPNPIPACGWFSQPSSIGVYLCLGLARFQPETYMYIYIYIYICIYIIMYIYIYLPSLPLSEPPRLGEPSKLAIAPENFRVDGAWIQAPFLWDQRPFTRHFGLHQGTELLRLLRHTQTCSSQERMGWPPIN